MGKYKSRDFYNKKYSLIGTIPSVDNTLIEYEPSLENYQSSIDIDHYFDNFYYPGFGFDQVENNNYYTDYSVDDAVKGIDNMFKHMGSDIIDEYEPTNDIYQQTKKPLKNIFDIATKYTCVTKEIFDRLLGRGLSQTDIAFIDQDKFMELGEYSPNNKKIQELYSKYNFEKMVKLYAQSVKQEDLLAEASQIAIKAPVLNKIGMMVDPSKADDQHLEEALDAYNTISNVRKQRGIVWKFFHPFKNSDEKKALASIEKSLKNYGLSQDTIDLAKSSNIEELREAKNIAADECNDLYTRSHDYNTLVLNSKEKLIDRQYNADLIIKEQQNTLLQDTLDFQNCFSNMNISGKKEFRKNEIDNTIFNLNKAIEIYNKYQSANRERQNGDLNKLPGLSSAELASACSDMEKRLFDYMPIENIEDLRDGKKVNVEKLVNTSFEKLDSQIKLFEEQQKQRELEEESVLDNDDELAI